MNTLPDDELNLSESDEALFLSICASDTVSPANSPTSSILRPHGDIGCPTDTSRASAVEPSQRFSLGTDTTLLPVVPSTPFAVNPISFYANCSYEFPVYSDTVSISRNGSTRVGKFHNAALTTIQPQSNPTKGHCGIRIPIPSTRRLSRPRQKPKTLVSELKNVDMFLKVPIKQLTEEEKKARRRAQVAKSARKHRNRQKEELIRLRKQVQLLQDRMLKMRLGACENYNTEIAAGSLNDTGPCKRKKLRYREQASDNECSDTSSVGVATCIPIEHWYHRLPVAREHRHQVIREFIRRRTELVVLYQQNEFKGNVLPYPHTNFFLYSTMPHLEIKVIRTKRFENVSPKVVAEAYWQSVARFDICLPQWLNGHVLVERLDEIDENTCYGRTISPLLYQHENRNSINLHSYVVHHRFRRENALYIMWETIQMDDLYSFERKPCRIYNNEVGSACFETVSNGTKGNDTVMHVVLHSVPPSDLRGESSSRYTQAFVTLYCRRTDVFESNTVFKLEELLRRNV
ncbi:unnamed protein product [Albugo candida]|nr:unnamed protein product [Albugo candida]|eukprot:CCI49580.1 unnamed protein product [Albugo candida]